MEAWIVTDEAITNVLDAASVAAKDILRLAPGGPVVGEQEGDDPQTIELILAEGYIYRVHIDFEVS
jgi:hypothetical protein